VEKTKEHTITVLANFSVPLLFIGEPRYQGCMVIPLPQRYFWFKYALAVILLVVLLVLPLFCSVTIGILLLLFLSARIILGPLQMYYYTKQGKFKDFQFLKHRNKLNVMVGIAVVATVVVLFFILLLQLFTVGALTLPILSLLAVFIFIDVGYDILTFFQLKKREE